ncbi:hypothetical protein O181_014671 [Austropuccinia psidii MF-1]|uniref:Uncharacterized protein n=1 Tax=Austropuccinia psidii MF-1 TaxID=1389203 RepID=A0A9Q3GPC4_9BASI|nr:hypothetical protein [Austropuccinia psidii MF-1]
MSIPHYPSMHIFICQHFSNQKKSSPGGDRQGFSFTPFQYKQHIDKLKYAIEPKAIPNIATLAFGSECWKILLDQIFPNYYSQLTQSTFTTPLGLNLTALKPYWGSQNLPPQDLGMIIFAIVSLRYIIPHRASHIPPRPEPTYKVRYLKLRWTLHSQIPYTSRSQYHI